MVTQFGNAVTKGGGAIATGAGHAASDARAMGASMGRGFSSAVRRWRNRNTSTRAWGNEYAQVAWTRHLHGADGLRGAARINANQMGRGMVTSTPAWDYPPHDPSSN